VGNKYPNLWHYRHMLDPREVSPGSNMPNYPWLFSAKTDVASLTSKLAVQRMLGVPYPDYKDGELILVVDKQAKAIADDLHAAGAVVEPDREIVALIAYLQKLGKYENVRPLKKVAGSE
jgi:cytochrome c oxidase cbb3-type subunit I/II